MRSECIFKVSYGSGCAMLQLFLFNEVFLQSSFRSLSINQGFAFKPFQLTSLSWLYLFMMYFPAVRLSFPVLSLLFLDCETTWNISVKAVLLKIPCQFQRATKRKHREITWLNSLTPTRFYWNTHKIHLLTFSHCSKNFLHRLPDKTGGKTVQMVRSILRGAFFQSSLSL